MRFEVKPYPELSWSISRQRKLDRCPRAFYCSYYLAWNGWLDDAPAESRMAYRLNKLTSLDALLGQQIDEPPSPHSQPAYARFTAFDTSTCG